MWHGNGDYVFLCILDYILLHIKKKVKKTTTLILVKFDFDKYIPCCLQPHVEQQQEHRSEVLMRGDELRGMGEGRRGNQRN